MLRGRELHLGLRAAVLIALTAVDESARPVGQVVRMNRVQRFTL